MKQNYTIAICDILGFKKLVQERPLDEVVQKHLAEFFQKLYHSIHQDGFPDKVPSLRQVQTQSKLGVAWFSDTIIIYTLKDSDENLQSLISTVSWLLFETILKGITHVRCGISYGETYIDAENAIYIGQPLIDAHLLEKAQVWSGGALTPEAIDRVPEFARGGTFLDWPVVPYDVPVESGSSKVAINWTVGRHIPPPLKLLWSSQSDTPTLNDWQENSKVCKMFQNTKDFHDKICRQCAKLV